MISLKFSKELTFGMGSYFEINLTTFNNTYDPGSFKSSSGCVGNFIRMSTLPDKDNPMKTVDLYWVLGTAQGLKSYEQSLSASVDRH